MSLLRKIASSSVLVPISFLGIAAASFVCYWSATDLFFVADDFVWLERAKYLIPKDPLTIFKSEGLYFDPLVYFSFWLNYNFSGLDPFWYHAGDVFIHTTNALLVACLALLLTQNKVAAFLSGLIFAVSPTNADAVIWPSSRVDTLAATFYLSSIISYVVYQKKEEGRFYYLSIIFFIISLSAKSTPIILPFVILALEITFTAEISYKGILPRFLPFFLISGTYLTLLFFSTPKTLFQTLHVFGEMNIEGFLRGISVLFFPESLIAPRENLFISLAVLLFFLILAVGNFYISARTFLVTVIIIASTMAPLLFMPSYGYATSLHPYYNVLGSICHRIYLAVIGFSIIVGAVITFFLEKAKKRRKLLYPAMCGLFTIIVFVYGFVFIKEREQIWIPQGKQYKGIVKNIKDLKYSIFRHSKIYFIDKPVSFTQSMSRLYLDNDDLIIEVIDNYSQATDPDAVVLRPVDIGS